MASENKKEQGIDLDKILLPKKETPGATAASAQRINAGVLLEQEQSATLQPEPKLPQKSPGGGVPNPQNGFGAKDFSAGVSAETPSVVSPASAASAPQEENIVRPLETYRGAIEEAVQSKNASIVSIAAAEAARRGRQAAAPVGEESGGNSHDLGFTIAAVAGGVLLLAGAAAVLAFMFLRPQATGPAASAPAAPFINIDETRLVAVSTAQWHRTGVMDALNSARQSTALSLGLMARLYLARSDGTADTALPPASAQEVLAAVAPNVPGEFLRSLTGESLIGAHSFDDNQAFLILGVESYEAAYRGMLDWELAMPQELVPLFVRTPRPRIPEENAAPVVLPEILPAEQPLSTTSTSTAGGTEQATTSTSTPATPQPTEPLPEFFRTRFVDRVVENHDARVIQNEFGDILLLWTFLDRQTLVITTNEYTLREIISRRSRPPVIPLE